MAPASDMAPQGHENFGKAVARHLDFVVLALALPVFIVFDWPLIGYAVAAIVWIVLAFAQNWMQKKIDTSDDPRVVVGWTAGGAMGRAWFAAMIALAAGISFGDDVGLAAVAMILVLFTVYFLTKVLGHYWATAGVALDAAAVAEKKQ